MKAVILAGGLGTRLSEETGTTPKPMVEIGEQPILWHIMKIYSFHGVHEFVICLGYKAHVIKSFFSSFRLRQSDMTLDFKRDTVTFHSNPAEPWIVHLVDTGLETMTGGRLRRVRHLIEGGTFCLTYGDGVSDVNIVDLVHFHRKHERLLTVTAVQPVGRFGTMVLGKGDDAVRTFTEKPNGDGAWISGGFFVAEPDVLNYITDDSTVWEHGPMARLAREDQMRAYRHSGFWHPMDTLREKTVLNDMWNSGRAPWKVWV